MRTFPLAMLTLAISACAKTPEPAAAPAATPPAAIADVKPEPATHGTPCAVAQQAPATAGSPAAVVAQFYEGFPKDDGGGAPDAATLERWRPHLSKALAAALKRAAAGRDAAATAHPDEKPPFVEGALFGSLFEGWTSAQPLTVATEGDRASVPVCFGYEADAQRTEWTDTVKLVREDGAWKIDDVVYGGTWDFANTGSLRDALPKP